MKNGVNEKPKSLLTEFALTFLAIILLFSIIARLESINKKEMMTFDEGLYLRLGYQLMKDPGNYCTREYYNWLKKNNQVAPEYLNAPVFMHPPLFPYLVSMSFSFFGKQQRAGEIISLSFGILTIFLIYYIAAYAFDDERKGLLASLLLAIDPVHWLCSKKIWIETTYVFFIYLGILLLIIGLKKDEKFLIFSGIALGLSLVSKHFAVLPYVGILIFAIFFVENIQSKKYFSMLMLMPVLIVFPWFLYNYRMYGNGDFVYNFISHHYQHPNPSKSAHGKLAKYALIGGVSFAIASLAAFTRVFCDKALSKLKDTIKLAIGNKIFKNIMFVISLILCFFIMDKIFYIQRFGYSYQPDVSQIMNYFTGKQKIFYVSRLTELVPLYYFGVISLLFIKRWNRYNFLMLLTVLPTLLFFSYFGQYECRYVLAAIPALGILSADTLIRLYDVFKSSSSNLIRYSRFVILIVIVYLVVKIVRFDFSFIVRDVVWYLL